jgi:hypothetical protein
MNTSPPSTPIRLVDLATVGIRLLAINLGFETIGFITRVLAGYHSREQWSTTAGMFVSILMTAIFFALWNFAHPIARMVTRGSEAQMNCAGLTVSDLYGFAFLITGLYFAIDSLGPTLTWFHYTLRQSATLAGASARQDANFYTLFKYCLRLGLGLALIFNGRRFVAKLVAREKRTGLESSTESSSGA